MTHTFEARWELDAEGLDMSDEELRREACRGPLSDLLHEAGAELLCTPREMDWRREGDELVASGPARPWHDCRSAGHTHQEAAA